MQVALVYDKINRIGGAERIISTLKEIYPRAPIYTFVYEPQLAPWAKAYAVETSFFQKIPLVRKRHEWFPILPIFAFENFRFWGFDLVISVTAQDAKGILSQENCTHICICLTPTRYLWSHYRIYFAGRLLRFLSLPAVVCLRIWDQLAAQRPDVMIAISQTVQKRITKYYRRESLLIYPPVDTHKFIPLEKPKSDYFLLVGRLVKYKRLDIAVYACQKLNLPLKIVGQGPEAESLKKIAGSKTELVGHLTDRQLVTYYQNCTALLFPQEEDFGITAVEAMACGKPVIGFGKGGAKELIQPGITGELFNQQTPESLINILKDFDYNKYLPTNCRAQAEKFSKDKFKQKILELVNNLKI